MSLHPAGNKIAVSVPLDDTTSVDQGAVWVYNYNSTTEKFGTVNGVDDNNIIITVPNTVINSPNNEQVEKFGYSVAFGKDGLVISSQNGDQHIPTRFDTYTKLLSDQSYVLDTSSTFDRINGDKMAELMRDQKIISKALDLLIELQDETRIHRIWDQKIKAYDQNVTDFKQGKYQ